MKNPRKKLPFTHLVSVPLGRVKTRVRHLLLSCDFRSILLLFFAQTKKNNKNYTATTPSKADLKEEWREQREEGSRDWPRGAQCPAEGWREGQSLAASSLPPQELSPSPGPGIFSLQLRRSQNVLPVSLSYFSAFHTFIFKERDQSLNSDSLCFSKFSSPSELHRHSNKLVKVTSSIPSQIFARVSHAVTAGPAWFSKWQRAAQS